MIVSLGFTIQSHSYHQSSFFNSSSWLTGNIYETSYGITSYFDLEKENDKLVEENKILRLQLFNKKKVVAIELDSAQLIYTITSGQVIKNSYANQRNYVTINKGRNDSIKPDMGVITSEGILGIIESVSNRYSTVQSILNENSNINAKLKNTNHFGSLKWNAETFNEVQLVDIPRLVPLVIGDTIVTGGMSSIFPENIPIGTIKKFDLNDSKSFWNIEIALFNDMTNINNVYIVNNTDQEEVIELQEETESNDK